MAELVPLPFDALLERMLTDIERDKSVFNLPLSKCWKPKGTSTVVHFQGQVAGSPFGPAAGPHTQLAQNIVLAWMAGARILELKTVQIMDTLEIPRPCIDVQNIGFNVEWSQELRLQDSLKEYVKAWYLVHVLQALNPLDAPVETMPTLFDMSVGYDLKGIKSEQVTGFIRGMMNATDLINELREQVPEAYAQFRDIEVPSTVSHNITLSTFHGCPGDEIESIVEYLLRDIGIDVVVKMNPTLHGYEGLRGLLHDRLGYTHLEPPEDAFEHDLKWDEACAMMERLHDVASGEGRTLGVKFSNTLVVENHKDFFPEEEKRMYMSGQPLHVLALSLVNKWRQHFGDKYPISFSAGVDAKNAAATVACGLVPVTTCTDLLRPGGYGRLTKYLRKLEAQMDLCDAESLDTFLLQAHGSAANALVAAEAKLGVDFDPTLILALPPHERHDKLKALFPESEAAIWRAWVDEAKTLNTGLIYEEVEVDRRYHAVKNARTPNQIDSTLALFDCINCDKCIPVCPNDANFAIEVSPSAGQTQVLRVSEAAVQVEARAGVAVKEVQQIANYADFCNECGNCDVFCPEVGGPYVVKPRFFSDEATWKTFEEHDGFFVEPAGEFYRALARVDGREYEVHLQGGTASIDTQGARLSVEWGPMTVLEARVLGGGEVTIPMEDLHIAKCVIEGALNSSRYNYVQAAFNRAKDNNRRML